ncbi:MAG TPA: UbiD family decarboxylase [Saprospiraceae bacterium]|nr:UbiD family decarboxylase [Saprospiraceae bacterium]
MSYKNLKSCIDDLESKGMLLRISQEVDPNLEMAEIHRRIYQKKGPAILFERVKNSPFKACSNLFGTNERCEYIFRDALKKMEHLIQLKIDPTQFFKSPIKSLRSVPYILKALPRTSFLRNPVISNECQISQLPQIISWPKDGGAFITLPQVISFPPNSQKLSEANVGMYRIQLSGNQYIQNEEIGLHYQLHRGIGIHHTAYLNSDEPFKISIGVGGPPAYTLASIFPLPEGLSEILFSGLLGNRSYKYSWKNGFFIPNEVDFCITGIVNKQQLKSEGPFGDHLGYYSLAHDFPVMNVQNVYHKTDPIWHFTAVGRPPQEDSGFGYLIHKMVHEITKAEFPGIKEIHAVDAAGVHPLLLAIGSERYMPFRDRKPEEILTLANHILGKGQTSLAKYLFIATEEPDRPLSTNHISDFLDYCLRRVDWRFDLHFYTNTTMDTLDYSGGTWNAGSKLVVACNRNVQRDLSSDISVFNEVNTLIKKIKLVQPGIIALEMESFVDSRSAKTEIDQLISQIENLDLKNFPLLVIVDDAQFTTADLNNFLWVTFTRSNPSHDTYGINSFTEYKHWGCRGSLIIDARIKPHHAPTLECDPQISSKVDVLFNTVSELKRFR